MSQIREQLGWWRAAAFLSVCFADRWRRVRIPGGPRGNRHDKTQYGPLETCGSFTQEPLSLEKPEIKTSPLILNANVSPYDGLREQRRQNSNYVTLRLLVMKQV